MEHVDLIDQRLKRTACVPAIVLIEIGMRIDENPYP